MEVLTTATSLHAQYPCLLGAWNGFCDYYTGQPFVFSLGEAISAFGLIFAVYQLKKTSWEIRLNIQGLLGNLFWILSGLGLLSILASLIVSNIPIGILSAPFGIPLLYEVLGFTFFVASPISLLILGRRKVIYNSFTCKKFYQRIHNEILRFEPERLEACIDIIRDNIPALLKAIAGNDKNTSSFAKYVFIIILSEQRVADYIVTQRMDFIGELFFSLKKHTGPVNEIRNGLRVMFRRFFENEKSVLYSQLGYEGFVLSANLYELIFEDYNLVDSFRPFKSGPNRLDRAHSRTSIKVFIEALKSSLKSYLSRKREYIDNYALLEGFEALNNYMEGICLSVAFGEVTIKEALPAISSVANFYGHVIPSLFESAVKNKNLYELDSKLTDFDDPEGLYEKYTQCLYEFIKNISVIDISSEDEWSIYHQLTEAYWGLRHDNFLTPVRENLLKLIWSQIEKNIKGTFPSVMRSYLASLPWWDDSRTGWEAMEVDKMKKKLLVLKPDFKTQKRMANKKTLMTDALLPPSISFSEIDDKIYYTNQFDELIEII